MKITISKRHVKRYSKRAIAFCVLACVITGTAAAADVTSSFTAHYKVKYGFIGLGTITFRLQPASKSNCYVYSGQGHPNAIVSMLIGALADKSRFCMTADDTVQPQYFRHHEDGSPKHSYSLTFNWQAGTVRYQSRDGNIRVMALPDTATDPLSLQIAARLWLAHAAKPAQLSPRGFTLIDADEIKTYTLAVEPGGTLNVPGGRFDTLIVKRVDHENKHLRFWLAQYADWIPVKVEHEKDGRTITMTLTSLERAQ